MRVDMFRSTPPVLPAAPQPSPTPAGAPIEVWVPATDGGLLDRVAQRTGGPLSSDKVVRDAYANAQRVLDYVKRDFGRDSFDGTGTVLKLRVHAPDPTTGQPNVGNAFWFNDEKRVWLGDGNGEDFLPLGNAADVIAHEFFHGVIDSELKLVYEGQEGALHESFADVLATGVDGNWKVAEQVFTPKVKGDALRDLAKLTYTDWRSFPEWQDEVHAMSEVPSHAAYLISRSLGDKAVRSIWYTALTNHLRDGAGFAGARDATIAAARTMYGVLSKEVQAVTDAWAAVGIDALTPKERAPLAPAAGIDATLAAALAQPRVPRLF